MIAISMTRIGLFDQRCFRNLSSMVTIWTDAQTHTHTLTITANCNNRLVLDCTLKLCKNKNSYPLFVNNWIILLLNLLTMMAIYINITQ